MIFVEEGERGEEGSAIPKLPLLPNLSRYWQQDIISPVLPFNCGNPNTATRDGFMLTDHDIDEINPVMKPLVFAEIPNGKDLMTRWQRAWIEMAGINPIHGRYANRDDEDILQRIPQRTRRSSL